jgi:hypothetical protein
MSRSVGAGCSVRDHSLLGATGSREGRRGGWLHCLRRMLPEGYCVASRWIAYGVVHLDTYVFG